MKDIREKIRNYLMEYGLKICTLKVGISNKKLNFFENKNVELKADDFIAIYKTLDVEPSFFIIEVWIERIKKIK